jgi:hypothetical protein
MLGDLWELGEDVSREGDGDSGWEYDAASLRGGEADFDQKEVPNSLLANEPSLSTQGTGGNCGS